MRQQVPRWALDQFAAEQAARRECERRWPADTNWAANEINGAKFKWRCGKGANDNVAGELVSPLYLSGTSTSPVVDIFVTARGCGSVAMAATCMPAKLMEKVPIEDVVLVPTETDSDSTMQQVGISPHTTPAARLSNAPNPNPLPNSNHGCAQLVSADWMCLCVCVQRAKQVATAKTSSHSTQLKDLLSIVFKTYEHRPLFGFYPEPLTGSVGTTGRDMQWLSYGAVYCGARAVAQWLRVKAQVPPGSFVASAGHNTPELLAVMLGCWLGGFVFVPIAPSFDDECTTHVLRETEAQVVFTNPRRASRWVGTSVTGSRCSR